MILTQRLPGGARRWHVHYSRFCDRIAIAVSLAVITAAAAILDAAAPRAFVPADHYRLRAIEDPHWSPDQRLVAFVQRVNDQATNRTRSSVSVVSAEGGSPRRLTPESDDDAQPRWSPDGRWLAVLSPVEDKPAIIIMAADGSGRRLLASYDTSNDPLAYQGVGEQVSWAPDSRSLAFLSADPGPEASDTDPYVITRFVYKAWAGMNDNRRWHIRIVSLEGGEVRQLTRGDYHEHSIAWSPRGNEIAFVSNRGSDPDRVHNYDLFAVKAADGSIRRLTDTPGSEYAPVWSPDGTTIAYQAGVRALITRESSAEDTHLWVLPASGGQPRELAASLDRRVMAVRWTTAREIHFRIQDRGIQTLHRIGPDGSGLAMVAGEPGSVGDFSVARNGAVAYAFTSPNSPSEIFITRSTERPRQLTSVNHELVAERDVSTPEAFDFASFDGTKVQAFLTPPLERTPGRRARLIVMIHGGPHGQQGPAFSHKPQVYAGRGFATLMVNYRGSTGYGQAFSDGTVGDQNGGEAKDVLAGLDAALARFDWIDPDQVAVEGGSYGGQLTNWLITQTTRFKAAIPSASISNLISLSYTIWAPDYPRVEFKGYPWERGNAAVMWERSPLAHVANVKTPTMLIHGELDQDVVITEAEQMYSALKQVGVEAVLLRYPREGHGLREPRHVVDALERSLAWYERHLPSRGETAR
jgi:dipeptidyl aminopeptidase/acylaminoacyl peptidase